MKIQALTTAMNERQAARLAKACDEIESWLERNGLAAFNTAIYPCPCCGDVMLSYYFKSDQLTAFKRLERQFWNHVQTLFPLHKSYRNQLKMKRTKRLFAADLSDLASGEWSIVVKPCDSTYGVEFPDRKFWKEVDEQMSAAEKQLN